jgi:hypothetical protein
MERGWRRVLRWPESGELIGVVNLIARRLRWTAVAGRLASHGDPTCAVHGEKSGARVRSGVARLRSLVRGLARTTAAGSRGNLSLRYV